MNNIPYIIYNTICGKNGVNINGAATKVTNLDSLGNKVRPGTFGKINKA